MPALTQIIAMRRRRRVASQRSPASKLGLNFSALLSLGIALGCLFLALEYAKLTKNLPAVESLPLLIDQPGGLYLQPTRFYDRTGEHLILEMQNPASAGWQYLPYPDQSTPGNPAEFLPQEVISTTIAALDPEFWSHPGFRLVAIHQGGPKTIAERLVSDLLLQDEPDSFRRALRERLLAMQVTNHYGRAQVIEWYLNSASYGRLAFGIDSASRLYFDKPASQLSLAEAALLAAVADDPTLNPLDAMPAVLERQKRILWNMLQWRMIRPQAGIQAAREQLIFRIVKTDGQSLPGVDFEPPVAPAFTRLAFEQVVAHIPRRRLERGGLRILTTLDYDLQQQLACASLFQAQRLGAEELETPAEAQMECAAAQLLPSLPGKIEPAPENLAVDGVILDPQTGQILALVGQPPNEPEYRALAARPAGTLSTLFIYLTAFTRGFSPASLLWDIPPADGNNTQQNIDGQYHGPVRLRMAMANDYLAPAEGVLTQVGTENVWRTARQLGLLLPENPARDALAVAQTTQSLFRPLDLVEISHALGVFANKGNLSGRAAEIQTGQAASSPPVNPALPPLIPVAILHVEDLSGKVYLDWSAAQSRPILTPELAYLMTHVLSDETARWPSLGHPNPLEIGRPAAAKTSSSLDGNSNWAMGYTPRRIVGVWLGQPDPDQASALPADSARTLRYAAAGLWYAIMQYSSRYLPFENFDIPPGLSILQVCDPSGLLPTVACPNVVDEVFLAGNEPIQTDTLYRLVPINRESGRLATIFSPPDLVEARSYISVPPEATIWAKRAGLETPPDMYDILPVAPPVRNKAQITSPAMFASVRSQVTITGTVSGGDIAFYRVQYGQGLNPSLWYPVGEDSQVPISNGKLAIWDAANLDGLYAVQLLLVRQDQSAERSTILVTVDNQPPEVKLLNPLPGETIQKSARPSIVLLAQVDENLELESVAFMIDGRLFARLTQPPYAISWKATPGKHSLRVLAMDKAGNVGESQATFEVK